MLLNAQGRPQPPEEIVRRLHQIDPRLGLEWVRWMGSLEGNRTEYWAITVQWAENDPRRKWIVEGQMPPDAARNIVGYLPLDCDVHEAYGYLVSGLRSGADDPDMSRMLNRVEEYNRRQQKAVMAPAMELGEELIETNAGSLFREEGKTAPKVYGPGEKDKTKKPPVLRRRDEA